MYDDFGLKLALEVRKHLALLGMESLEARWRSSFKSISEGKGYSDWNYKGFPPPLAKLVLSGTEKTLILVWWCLGGSYIDVVRLGKNISVLC